MVALSAPNVRFGIPPDPNLIQYGWVELSKANTGDTVDVAAMFGTVFHAIFFNRTAPGHGAGAVAGTTITVPAGWTNDSGGIVVFGR